MLVCQIRRLCRTLPRFTLRILPLTRAFRRDLSPQAAGQSHVTLKGRWRRNRIVNEIESDRERLSRFLSVNPNFRPYAIALPRAGRGRNRRAAEVSGEGESPRTVLAENPPHPHRGRAANSPRTR